MAFNGSCVVQVQTDGDNTNNGGIFDFSTTNKSTNLAATNATSAAPVVTSATYTFVAGDVGAWLYIAAGTNWRPGLYQISSVSAGAATINATAGEYYLCDTLGPIRLGASNGCATTASPTGGTWSVDYTQSASARYTYTDLVQATTTTCTSAANPFGPNCIGNSISITGGTGTWTTQRVLITNVVGTTATVDKTLGGSGGTSGTGRLGGAIASLGLAQALKSWGGMDAFVKAGTYTITSATANATAGPVNDNTGGISTNPANWVGYSTHRHWGNTDTGPLVQVSGAISSFKIVETNATYSAWWNFTLDGASKSAVSGLYQNSNYGIAGRIVVKNCTSYGLMVQGNSVAFQCVATGCSGSAAIYAAGRTYGCEAYANSTHGFVIGSGTVQLSDCLSYGNTGASTDGFNDGSGTFGFNAINCTAYGNGRAGFNLTAGFPCLLVNCAAEANTGVGYRTTAASGTVTLLNCAGYNNSSNYDTTQIPNVLGFVAGSASFFTDPASGDFALNNNAGGGALLRGAGWLGASPRGATTGYANIGTYDPQATSGGSSGARLVGPSALVSA